MTGLQFHLLVASWESLAVVRPLWETGLWAADTGRQAGKRVQALQSSVLLGVACATAWGQVGHGQARSGVCSIHASGLTSFPIKVRSRDIIWNMPLGSPGLSVLEGVASVFCLLLLCNQQFPIHLLQGVVYIVPIEVSVPLCLGAQEQVHIDHNADQQQEN